MTITATVFGGNQTGGTQNLVNLSGTLTSSAGDRIVVLSTWYDIGANSVAQVGGHIVSSPAKTFVKDTEFVGATPTGLAVYSWVSDGTTLNTITVAPNGTNIASVGGVAFKLASTAGTVAYDATTKGTGTDSTTPFAWSAGAAIAGTQIGFTAVVVDNNVTGVWTPSSGYTDAFNYANGAAGLTEEFAYKTPETGTPSLSVAYTGGGIIGVKELFVSFAEPAPSNPTPAAVATPVGIPASTIAAPSPTAIYIGEIGQATSNASGTTLAITAAIDVQVGDFILIGVAGDNAGTSGAARTISVADNSAQPGTANTYNATNINRTAASVANDGTTATILRSNVTRKILTGDVITLTFSGALTAKAATAQSFRNVYGPNISSNTASGASTAPTAAATPLVAGQLVAAIVAVEGPVADTYTQDSDTLNGSWVGVTRRGIGTTTAGQTINFAYKIVTASGAQTYNPTLGTSTDWAEIVQAFPILVAPTAVATPVIIPSPSLALGDATATPAAVATPVGIPAPTITSSPTVTPAAVATPVTIPAPVIALTALPAAVATPVGIPAPTITSSPTVTPAAVATPVTIPAPTITSSPTVQPAVVATPVTIPAVSVTIAKVVQPAAVATPVTIPAPTITSSPGAATPAAVATPVAVPAPTITSSPTVQAAVVATPVTIPAATVLVSATTIPAAVATPVAVPGVTITSSPTVAAAVVATPVAIPAPIVLAGGGATATPAAVATPVTIPSLAAVVSATAIPGVVATPVSVAAVTITTSGVATPQVVATPVAIPAVSITATAVPAPAAIATPVTIPAPSIFAGGGATVNPAAVATPVTIPPVGVGGSAIVSPGAVGTPVTVPQPVVTSSPTATPAVVALFAVVPSLTAVVTALTTPGAVGTPVVILAPLVGTQSYASAGVVATPVTIVAPTVTSAALASPGVVPLQVTIPYVLAGEPIPPPVWTGGTLTTKRIDVMRATKRIDAPRLSQRLDGPRTTRGA